MTNRLEIELKSILKAKEVRTALKTRNAGNDLNSLTFTLNIPGIPKTTPLITVFFNEVVKNFKRYLIANRVFLSKKNEKIIIDKAGNFLIISFTDKQIKPVKLKKLTEIYEQEHKLGRLIDLDIFCHKTGHISSGKEKKCYFCEAYSAVYCMRNKRHSYSEIRNKINFDIENYLTGLNTESFINNLCSLAARAVLYEVSLSPKPGLVDFTNSGVHKDMNYYSFLNSSSVLPAYFMEFCRLGINFSGKWKEVLPKIRKIGLQAEEDMLSATSGVNTQKGLIFMMGISLFAYSYLYVKKQKLTHKNFRNTVKEIAKNIVDKELKIGKLKNKTHGEKVFEKYKNAGIRYEVEKAFPIVFKTAIPFFKKNFKKETFLNQNNLNEILKTALLKIMAVNNDTNILYRSNPKVLEKIKNLSIQSINNNIGYKKLCKFCDKHKVSPGGSADLLALSVFIHLVSKNYKTIKYEF